MPEVSTLAKWIVVFGIGVIVVGLLVWVVDRLGLPLGRLPGDISFQQGNFSVYFPCATSIVISIVLTILLNLAVRFFFRR